MNQYGYGDNRLKIGISTADSSVNRPSGFSSTFYNTQGRQRPVVATVPWTVSADVYISSSFDTTTGALVRTDLWTRDSNPDENSASYPILGFTNNSPTDALNPSAGDRSVRFQAWDGDIGWVNLGLPLGFAFNAWHNVSITSFGNSFEYRIDGSLLYTDLTGSAIGSEALQAVFLEAYNFGDSDYSAYWDNLTVSQVPEPASLALVLVEAWDFCLDVVRKSEFLCGQGPVCACMRAFFVRKTIFVML